MNWKDYEKEIYQELEKLYPDSTITYDARVIGRYSEIERQVDILIEDFVAGEQITIMVDAKFFSSPVDVKEVESYIGMMQDIGADKGLLITQVGYSKAALNRAHNDPSRVELDVLNFEQLKAFQAFGAIPYSGKHACALKAPFGWVVEAQPQKGCLAALYQRGSSFEEAVSENEWMYVNIFSKTDEIPDLDSFIEFQNARLVKDFTVGYLPAAKRPDASTRIRVLNVDQYPTTEFTGFVDFEDAIFFCVLFSPKHHEEKNLKKLRSVLATVKLLYVDEDSLIESKLEELSYRLENAEDSITKANILIAQGNIFFDNGNYEEAKAKYNESIKVKTDSYGALKGLLEIALQSSAPIDEVDSAVDSFFSIAPRNPTVCQDLLDLCAQTGSEDLYERIMRRKELDYADNDEARGNILYHIALFQESKGDMNSAKSSLISARALFEKSLPKGHMVFEVIKQKLNGMR